MLPFLVFSDQLGKIYIHPYLKLVAKSWDRFVIPEEEAFIPLPEGSSFYFLPKRIPVGFNTYSKDLEAVNRFKGKKVFALSAFTPPAYMRVYNPASVSKSRMEILPLWSYTAVGWYGGKFWVASKRVDSKLRQSPRFYQDQDLSAKVRAWICRYPKNRLLKHLSHCALNYNCLAAKNLFLNRWEAPLPVSPVCNSRCLGCLSKQDKFCASHERIKFVPSPLEIEQIAVEHLKKAREAIVSFGQGCEGEPILQTSTIEKAVRNIRSKVSRGSIHINTNASFPLYIKRLAVSGIDSIRVSLNSTRENFYNKYFGPRGYKFSHVVRSIEIAKKSKLFVSINLLVFPGFTDSSAEIDSLCRFIKNTGIDMIQLRNLNIDPDYYISKISYVPKEILGLTGLVNLLKREFPKLKLGYFNKTKEEFALKG